MKNKMLKVLKFLYGIGKAILLFFIILFALTVCLQRMSNNSLSLFNYRMFSVVTGSMVPKYQIGDVLFCKEVEIDTLKPGDDISYVGLDGTYNDKVITHRIIRIEEVDGKKLFFTKGIASKKVDPVVYPEQIYGKIIGEVPIVSALYKFISTSKGFYMAIFIPLTLLIGSEVISTMIERTKDKKEKALKKISDNSNVKMDEESVKLEIEKLKLEIAEKKAREEEKKKAAIKEEIEKLKKEIDSKNKE